MARWHKPKRRLGLSDDELIAGYDEWHRGWPHPLAHEARRAYRGQYQAWLAEAGVSWGEIETMFHRATLAFSRWMSESKGLEWRGLDVPPVRPPDPSLWECPSCGRVTWPHAGSVVSWLHGTATLCVPCLRAQAGYGYVDEKWGRK